MKSGQFKLQLVFDIILEDTILEDKILEDKILEDTILICEVFFHISYYILQVNYLRNRFKV